MEHKELLPHLFRTEYQKLVSVLCSLFGIQHVETAEDIVSDTFLSATENWSHHGLPNNPTAWLYTVAKNKTKNHLKRHALFQQKLSPELQREGATGHEIEVDLSLKNISDSQLAMIFAVCDPVNPSEAQIALALNLLCGFGAQEIADAFLTNKEVIYKRINRAKDKLRETNVRIAQPSITEIGSRLDTVLTTLYLLFSEGYYSVSQNTTLRKEFCIEAMRLTYLLIQNATTNNPKVNALMSLMCFHSSRFDARINEKGEAILYHEQNESLWNQELIQRGKYFLNNAAAGTNLSKYHLEAGIAYWHTQKEDTTEKWQSILELYNSLLTLEHSPVAALNRAYVVSKTSGKEAAIIEAEKLALTSDHFYFSLLGNLYTELDNGRAIQYYQKAISLTSSMAEQTMIRKKIEDIGPL
jgi:RNA polymerase sigma factor (sigma-70 family)